MDVNTFLLSLFQTLSKHDLVKDVELKREAFVIKGKLILTNGRCVLIYFNEFTSTTAFTLLENNKRI